MNCQNGSTPDFPFQAKITIYHELTQIARQKRERKKKLIEIKFHVFSFVVRLKFEIASSRPK